MYEMDTGQTHRAYYFIQIFSFIIQFRLFIAPDGIYADRTWIRV